jgi:hypothetical protein
MTKRLIFVIALLGACIAGLAFADGPVPEWVDTEVEVEGVGTSPLDLDNPVEVAAKLHSALVAGQWLVAFACVLMLLVWSLRHPMLLGRIAWFRTKMGGRALAYFVAAVLAAVPMILAGQAPSLALIPAILGAVWAAHGQWEDVKDVKGEG